MITTLQDTPPVPLGGGLIQQLRGIPTPTVANATELLTGTRDAGLFTRSGVQCIFPRLGRMVGYACTATILSSQPGRQPRRVDRRAYWEYLQAQPGPSIVVMQDLSREPAGAYWGEVNANIHKALGCSGVLTDGLVRDIEEVESAGFQMFASGVGVSHAWAHLEDFDRPVTVFGLHVRTGDLIHADCHGAVVIPSAIAAEIPATADRITGDERKILDLCRSPRFSPSSLDPMISKEY